MRGASENKKSSIDEASEKEKEVSIYYIYIYFTTGQILGIGCARREIRALCRPVASRHILASSIHFPVLILFLGVV